MRAGALEEVSTIFARSEFGTCSKWEGVMPALRQHYRVIRLDLAPFGLTGPLRDAYGRIVTMDIDAYRAFIDAFLAAVNIARATLVGNSLGGLIAWDLAARRPAAEASEIRPAAFSTSRRQFQPGASSGSRSARVRRFHQRSAATSAVPMIAASDAHHEASIGTSYMTFDTDNFTVADILAVMDHAGVERAHVAGLSMGGFATLHFGLQHPGRALSLCVAGCGYGAEPAQRDRFREEAAACTRCHLYKHATQTVFGEGPVTASMMFVGEQPGDQEDLAGTPFVGPAGQVFNRAIAEAEIDRARVYVTNAVKHFKFEQRGKRRIHAKPDTGEIQACRWWIEQEQMLIRPRVTVALGATAAHSLLGRTVTIGRERGKAITLPDGGEAWITVHPSYLLRLPDETQKAEEYARFVEDLKQAKAALG